MSIDQLSKNKTFPSRNHRLDGLKVLLADDDQLNILIVRKILSPWDIAISVAENGLAAVEMARTKSFDLILMDVQMPVMDGLAASKEIKKFNHDTPIVIITSLPPSEVREDFNKIGIIEFVFKPVNKDNLYQMLLKYAQKKDNDKGRAFYPTPEVQIGGGLRKGI